MKRYITKEEYEYMRDFLPPQKKTGRPRVDNEKLLNGIIYILKTGCRWNDMPTEYGNGKTAHRRFKELEKIDFFEKINKKLLKTFHSKVQLKKNINR
jgi:transposase